MWEIFNPKFGNPVFTVRYEWVAKCLAHLLAMDYAKKGEGYVQG